PLAALGGKETGGMNVYVREGARHLGRLGLAGGVFTRKQTPGVPAGRPLRRGPRGSPNAAGPPRPGAPPGGLGDPRACSARRMAFQRRTDAEYALFHGHYWLSGLVAVELSRRLRGVPVVQMFHTLGVVKNALADHPGDQVPKARVDAEVQVAARADRIVAATPLESAELAWYCGADVARVRTIPCGVHVERFSPGRPVAARARLGLSAAWVLLFVGRPAPVKGLEVLLQALARLRADGLARADVRLVIVGGDLNDEGNEDRARLRALAGSLGVGA